MSHVLTISPLNLFALIFYIKNQSHIFHLNVEIVKTYVYPSIYTQKEEKGG